MGQEIFHLIAATDAAPTCSGLGFERIEMQFVSDLFIPCESCEGQRFKDEVLRIEFNGKSIADILELDIAEAMLFSAMIPIRQAQPVLKLSAASNLWSRLA